MATPNPTPPTHQSSSSAAPKRHRHRRHTQHRPAEPEEPPSPAKSGRADGLAQPSTRSKRNEHQPGTTSLPAAPRGTGLDAPAVEGEWLSTELLASTNRSCSSPTCAGNGTAGTSVQLVGTTPSGDLAMSERRGCGEGTVGLARLLPVSANSAKRSNDGHRNSSKIQVEGAAKVFDDLPNRNPSMSSVWGVSTEEGEVWERSPAMVVTEGSSIRATYSLSTQLTPAADDAVQNQRSNLNAGNLRQPEMMGVPHGALDTPAGAIRGRGGAPVCAGAAAELHAPSRQLLRPDCDVVSMQLPHRAISSSNDLRGSSSDLWQANISSFASGEVDNGGGPASTISGGPKSGQIWADCTVSAPDLGHNSDATDFNSLGGQSRGQVGMVQGQFDSTLGMVGGVGVSRVHKADQLKGATQHRQTDNAADLRNHAVGQTLAWGRPPGPSQQGIARDWIPAYHEAFPSIRGGRPLEASPGPDPSQVEASIRLAAPSSTVNSALHVQGAVPSPGSVPAGAAAALGLMEVPPCVGADLEPYAAMRRAVDALGAAVASPSDVAFSGICC